MSEHRSAHKPSKGSSLFLASTWMIVVIGCVSIMWAYMAINGQDTRRQAMTLNALSRYQPKIVPPNTCNLAFGYCADRDIAINGVELMKALSLPHAHPIHHELIHDLHELAETFAYFFSKGAAAEQVMVDRALFKKVVNIAARMHDAKHSLGGNAATLANRAAKEGCQVLLGASVGPALLPFLHDNVDLVGDAEEYEEDVHLVLEYAKGQSWGPLTAPRANRYYLNHDLHNARLTVLDNFHAKLSTANISLLGLGGLQLLEGNSDQLNLELLKSVSEKLHQNLNQHGLIDFHLELASFSEVHLYQTIADHLFPLVTSLGLNEQELASLYHFLRDNHIQPSSPSIPDVQDVVNTVQLTFAMLLDRGLTRMHFHTLQFQMLCHTDAWANPVAALARASLVATEEACGQSDINVESIDLMVPDQITVQQVDSPKVLSFDPSEPIRCWQPDAKYSCCMVPVLVCKTPVKTAGLGDNISGAGLAHHRKQMSR